MTTINLLPNDYVRRSASRRANVLCLALFAVTMAAVVTAALVSERSSRHTRTVRDEVDASYAVAAKQIQQMQELEARKQNMLDRAEAISSLQERVPRSHLLGVIANCLPEHVALSRVDLDTKKTVVAPPKDKSAGGGASKFDAVSAARTDKEVTYTVVMDVTGLASTDVQVARFIAALAKNPLIASVDLVFSQEKVVDKTTLREFQLHLELEKAADAIQDSSEAVAEASDHDKTGNNSTGVGQ